MVLKDSGHIIINNNCTEINNLNDGPRDERRVNITFVVLVIPLEKDKIQTTKAFYAVTKDFASTGVSVLADTTREVDEVILAIRWEGEMTYLLAKTMHISPLGGGFQQFGFKFEKIVAPLDYPGLSRMQY